MNREVEITRQFEQKLENTVCSPAGERQIKWRYNGYAFQISEGPLTKKDSQQTKILPTNGWRIYMRDGKLHRLNGPAKTIGNVIKRYYVNGEEFTEIEHTFFIKGKNHE